MFKVLKVDGPNIVTDRGGVSLSPFSYADGGKSYPVSTVDWKAMRQLFLAAPSLVAALTKLLETRGWAVAGIRSRGQPDSVLEEFGATCLLAKAALLMAGFPVKEPASQT